MDNFWACVKLWSYAESIHRLSTNASVEVIHRVNEGIKREIRPKEGRLSPVRLLFFFYFFAELRSGLKPEMFVLQLIINDRQGEPCQN